MYPGTAQIFGVPLYSQERVKLRTSNFVGIFIGLIGTKDHKNVGNSSRGRSHGVQKIQGTHRAHRAVIFATAQLSCFVVVPNSSDLLQVNMGSSKPNFWDLLEQDFLQTICPSVAHQKTR